MLYNSQFELQVRPNGRAAADEYYHQGNWFIEGREGSRYTIWFKNNLPVRVMAIFSVDGLDVCKGQPAGPDSDGYIVDAYSSIEVPGWKLDGNTAAEFFFAGIGKSYASASGANTNNVGVIGAMVFREKDRQAYAYPAFPGYGMNPLTYANNGMYPNNMVYSGSVASSAASATPNSLRSIQISTSGWDESVACSNTVGMNSVQAVAQSVGTGFGDATQFKTTQVTFERANATVPDALMVLYYNSAKNLQKMGIQLRTKSNRYDTSNTAQAFPGYTTGCTPPPGWTN